VGVGYKAELLNLDKLVLKLGYSHDILLDIPEKLTVACPKDNILILKSYCKESLGSFVSLLKKSKTPDIYKNKGVLVIGEPLVTKKFKKK
jgi:large subunit ribosomal protein L6